MLGLTTTYMYCRQAPEEQRIANKSINTSTCLFINMYHILLINRTVRVEVGKIFCRWGVGNLPLNWGYTPASSKIVDWSIV